MIPHGCRPWFIAERMLGIDVASSLCTRQANSAANAVAIFVLQGTLWQEKWGALPRSPQQVGFRTQESIRSLAVRFQASHSNLKIEVNHLKEIWIIMHKQQLPLCIITTMISKFQPALSTTNIVTISYYHLNESATIIKSYYLLSSTNQTVTMIIDCYNSTVIYCHLTKKQSASYGCHNHHHQLSNIHLL